MGMVYTIEEMLIGLPFDEQMKRRGAHAPFSCDALSNNYIHYKNIFNIMEERAKNLTLDQEITLSCAFRYALGRMTYVTSSVTSELIRLESQLPQTFKSRIAKEIQEYQDEHGSAGMDMDNREWNKVKWLFDKGRHVRVIPYFPDGMKSPETDAVKGDDGQYYSMKMEQFYKAEEVCRQK